MKSSSFRKNLLFVSLFFGVGFIWAQKRRHFGTPARDADDRFYYPLLHCSAADLPPIESYCSYGKSRPLKDNCGGVVIAGKADGKRGTTSILRMSCIFFYFSFNLCNYSRHKRTRDIWLSTIKYNHLHLDLRRKTNRLYFVIGRIAVNKARDKDLSLFKVQSMVQFYKKKGTKLCRDKQRSFA